MAFWDSQRNAPLAPPVLIAMWALHHYVALGVIYIAWQAFAAGFNVDEAILIGIRSAAAEVVAWGLRRRMPWALWLGVAAGVFGALGLIFVALALSHSGSAGLPLGMVTAAYSILSAVCLALTGALLARNDARASFGPASAQSAPPAA